MYIYIYKHLYSVPKWLSKVMRLNDPLPDNSMNLHCTKALFLEKEILIIAISLKSYNRDFLALSVFLRQLCVCVCVFACVRILTLQSCMIVAG